MNIFFLSGLCSTLLGGACIYLASPNQRWLASSWPAAPARGAGLVLLLLGLLGLAWGVHAIVAVFFFITLLMLEFAVLPYLGALLAYWRGR